MKKAPQNKRSWIEIILLTIKRFSQDIFGIIFISLGLITILGFFGLTQGNLSDTWVNWLSTGFGLGKIFFTVLLFYFGFLILFRHLERFPKMDIKRIFILELGFFSFLGLLSMLNGQSIERAYQGLDGGVIGWGFARMINDLLGFHIATILLFIIFLISITSISGISSHVMGKLDNYFSKVVSSSYASGIVHDENQLTHDEKIDLYDQQENDLNKNFRQTQKSDSEKKPPIDLLLPAQKSISDESFIHTKAIQIENTLAEFGIPARVAGYRVGPTIIQYAIEPGFVEKVDEDGNIVKKKVRVSQIAALNRDLSLALSVERLRIEAPIPGHSFVGIEIPNLNSTVVRLRQIIQTEEFQNKKSTLMMALGLDVSGTPVVADLARMPHLLVAGTTGSGKSVYLTSIIACLVFNNSPHNLKLIILDPKMVELVRFNGLPHLLGKVETQIERMIASLAWTVREMENRIRLLESVNAKDLDSYNLKMRQRGKEPLPKIVVLIDELADLMVSSPEKTEGYLVRLAQIARATGIHLVVATQRPSTDVITGLIKANFPARISFMMATSIDSRVILDSNGAETLMGNGDLLFLDPEKPGLKRAQGVLIDDREIENLISFWQDTGNTDMDEKISPWEDLVFDIEDEDGDELINQAIELIRKEGRASTSRLQRKLRIGFPRAARIMDELEQKGIVGPVEGGGRDREVLTENDDSEYTDDLEREN